MTTEDEFLNAIKADDPERPPLGVCGAFADWLDEQGRTGEAEAVRLVYAEGKEPCVGKGRVDWWADGLTVPSTPAVQIVSSAIYGHLSSSVSTGIRPGVTASFASATYPTRGDAYLDLVLAVTELATGRDTRVKAESNATISMDDLPPLPIIHIPFHFGSLETLQFYPKRV